MKYIKRLLALPFLAGLILVSTLWKIAVELYLFVRFGGEFLRYSRDHDPKTFADILNKLDEKL